MPDSVGKDDTSVLLSNQPCIDLLKAKGIKGNSEQLAEAAERFNNDPFVLNLLAAFLSRWHSKRLNGISYLPMGTDKSARLSIDNILAAFEHKLRDTSDMTLLYLLSLSDQPVPQQHLKNVFRSTLMERWLTRRDEYVRFLSPLGRLNEEHWHWVIENLRRLNLLEQPMSGQHDLLFVAPAIRQYFRKKLLSRSASLYEQASADMQKLFTDTVIEFKQRYFDTPEIKTWISPELVAEFDREREERDRKKQPVQWKKEELETAQQQLSALRQSLNDLKSQCDQLHQLQSSWELPVLTQSGDHKISVVK